MRETRFGDEIAAVVIAGLAFLASAYAVTAGEVRAHRTRSQKLALGPAPGEVREALQRVRAAFEEIVVHGGHDRAFFLDDDTRGIGQSLSDNAARVGNAELRTALEQVARTWIQAFATSPPHPYVINPEAPPDPERQRQLAAVAELAYRGEDECVDALAQINALEAGS